METSELRLVSVFCNMQRTPLSDGKGTIFFLSSIVCEGKSWKLELFTLKSMFDK